MACTQQRAFGIFSDLRRKPENVLCQLPLQLEHRHVPDAQTRGEFSLEVGQHEETSTTPSPHSTEVGGRGTRIWEHADGGGSGVLSPAPEVNAVTSFFFLLWRVLLSPLSTARAGSHRAASRNGYAQVPPGLGDLITAAAHSRTEHSWTDRPLQSGHGTSFSASPPLQGAWGLMVSSPPVQMYRH